MPIPVPLCSSGSRGGGREGAAATNCDPLMPLLFCLAVHDAFAQVQEHLQEGEVIFAFHDDVHVLSAPERSRDIYDLLVRSCTTWQGFVCMLEKHERGTEWGYGCGVLKV